MSEGKKACKVDVQTVDCSGTDEEVAARCAETVVGWGKLSAREQAEMVDLQKRFHALTDSPGFKAKSEGSALALEIEGNYTLATLRAAVGMGTREIDFFNGRAIELVAHQGAINSQRTPAEYMNDALAFLAGAGATDTVQSSLAVQMKATHDNAMVALRRAATTNVEQAQIFGNIATKLLNAYTRQAETLRKLQKGGEQTVRHVHVDNRGGQAVFTEQVNHTGGAPKNVQSQAREQHSSCDGSAAMLGYDPAWYGVPASSHEGQEALQPARRQVDGTKEPGRQ